MAVFKTSRAGRNQDGYMESLIGNMYNNENVFYKNGCGVCGFGPEDIANCFNAIRKIFCKINQKIKKNNFPLSLSLDDRPACYITITTKKWLKKGSTTPGKSGG